MLSPKGEFKGLWGIRMGIQFTRSDGKPRSIHDELLGILIPAPPAAFLFKENGAICIVDRSVSPSNGDNVIIYDESQGFQRITFSERVDNEQVWGVVTWICHEACGSKANSSVRL